MKTVEEKIKQVLAYDTQIPIELIPNISTKLKEIAEQYAKDFAEWYADMQFIYIDYNSDNTTEYWTSKLDGRYTINELITLYNKAIKKNQ